MARDTEGRIEASQNGSERDVLWRRSTLDRFANFFCTCPFLTQQLTNCDIASSDETVQIVTYPIPLDTKPPKLIPPITHPKPVRALLPLSLTLLGEQILLTGNGDVIRTYDVSSPEEPELLGEVDGHWHDVLALRLWLRQRKSVGSGKVTIEPWIVSTSLDGTIRKWRLSGKCYTHPKRREILTGSSFTELVKPPTPAERKEVAIAPPKQEDEAYKMSEEEERELAELMDSD